VLITIAATSVTPQRMR